MAAVLIVRRVYRGRRQPMPWAQGGGPGSARRLRGSRCAALGLCNLRRKRRPDKRHELTQQFVRPLLQGKVPAVGQHGGARAPQRASDLRASVSEA